MATEEVVRHLRSVLLELHAHPYPDVACPPNVSKRASVALIIRIQPQYAYWPESLEKAPPAPLLPRPHRLSSPTTASQETDFEASLSAFFEQDWVKHGDPEVLFIKRAARPGDKWNGHVALPGGKRDPEDDDDAMTAAREAWEEVGIDLGQGNAISIGNLPQRIVTTSWGKVPLMVLCPYLYLLTSPAYPAQRLQPTEVASSHWVPVRALLSPDLRTYEYADVSARLAKSDAIVKQWFLQAMLSKMMFAAIRLLPTNSTHCATIPDFVSGSIHRADGALAYIQGAWMGAEARRRDGKPPLLLWGLTLGVVSDFLEHMPPHNALELWTYPTFTHWDVRFLIWAMSYRFRKQKALEMATVASSVSSATMDRASGNVPVQDFPGIGSEAMGALYGKQLGEADISGLGVGTEWRQTGRAKMIARGAAVNSLLEGYYPLVRRAVTTAVVGRLSMAALLALLAWRTVRQAV